MEYISIYTALWRCKLLVMLVCALAIGAAAAVTLLSHSKATGSATAQLLVDSPDSAIADLSQAADPLAQRALVIAEISASPLIQQKVAESAGVPADDVTAAGPFDATAQSAGAAASPAAPSSGAGSSGGPAGGVYRLSFVAQSQLPIITVSAHAPTAARAAKLANSVYPVMSAYLATLQASPQTSQPSTKTISPQHRVTIRQLGPAQLGSQSSSATVMAVAAFAVVMLGGLLTVFGLDRARNPRERQRDEAGTQDLADSSGLAELQWAFSADQFGFEALDRELSPSRELDLTPPSGAE